MNHNYPEGRFPDMSNLPKPRWRDALLKLASPATRMHRFRDLRTAAIEESIKDTDCGRNS